MRCLGRPADSKISLTQKSELDGVDRCRCSRHRLPSYRHLAARTRSMRSPMQPLTTMPSLCLPVPGRGDLWSDSRRGAGCRPLEKALRKEEERKPRDGESEYERHHYHGSHGEAAGKTVAEARSTSACASLSTPMTVQCRDLVRWFPSEYRPRRQELADAAWRGGVKASKQHGVRRPVVGRRILSVSGSRVGVGVGC